jgi:pimeloyl-ACP methyl ester carboxylesterase
MPEITLSQGTVHYRDEGSGAPIVLIHGLLVNGTVWDRLVPELSSNYRVIVPDLPLGSHRPAMDPGADLAPPALAALIAELLEKLELDGVTLVGNDTGGALCQLVVTAHPERIGRLVLINCDAFEHFPPPAFKLLFGLLRRPTMVSLLALLGRSRVTRRAAMSLAPLTVETVPDELYVSWMSPVRDAGVRHDLLKVVRGVSPVQTLAAAERFGEFDRPVLVVWGTDDPFFPIGDAERLVAAFPDARLVKLDRARTFVQLDAPGRLADAIRAFAPSGAEAVLSGKET